MSVLSRRTQRCNQYLKWRSYERDKTFTISKLHVKKSPLHGVHGQVGQRDKYGWKADGGRLRCQNRGKKSAALLSSVSHVQEPPTLKLKRVRCSNASLNLPIPFLPAHRHRRHTQTPRRLRQLRQPPSSAAHVRYAHPPAN